MVFINSFKLFGSNWKKALKFFLFYLFVWGLCFSLFLPVFFEFKNLIASNFAQAQTLDAFGGVFQGSLGANMQNLIITSFNTIADILNANLGLAIYGLIVVFIFLPFLINVGKYSFYEMLYFYMTSNNELGFFSALVKGLKKSLLFALVKTLYNLVFVAITLGGVYALALVENNFFVDYLLPIAEFVVLVIMFSINQINILGWIPALIVFDVNVFSGYRKGLKAVKRHFWAILGTTTLFFVIFWLLAVLFGVYSLALLIPVMSSILIVYNMVAFFTSQGMRFYINSKNILTPKKLEEVDNINKIASIL